MKQIKVDESGPTRQQWRDLRDAKGKLYGRVEMKEHLLEIRRNHETVRFDLHEYLETKETPTNDE